MLGGNWASCSSGAVTSLVGHLRVKPNIATKLLAAGGKQGIFVWQVSPKTPASNPSNPFWVRREKDEPREKYFRRSFNLAAQLKQPMIFRAGRGSDIGFPTAQDRDKRPVSPKHATLRGAPRAWTDTEVCSFLEGQKWTEVKTTSKIEGVWHLMAVPPPNELSPSCWRYELESKDKDPVCITVHVAQRSSRAYSQSAFLCGALGRSPESGAPRRTTILRVQAQPRWTRSLLPPPPQGTRRRPRERA